MTIPDAARPRRPRRTTLAAAAGWAAALVLAGFVALVLHSVQDSNRRLADGQTAQATVISRLSTGLDTTRKQLQQHGVTPSAPPARSIVGAVPGLPGAAGAQGVPGAAGSPGTQGTPGVPGKTGAQGSPGADSTVPGPIGAAGADGAQGVPGVAGTDGKDGAAGQDGKDGTNGKDGANGAPPAGWTYTDPSGQSYTCGPVDNFDASAPRYTCTADTTAAPTGSATSSGLAGVGMLIASAAYRRLP